VDKIIHSECEKHGFCEKYEVNLPQIPLKNPRIEETQRFRGSLWQNPNCLWFSCAEHL